MDREVSQTGIWILIEKENNINIKKQAEELEKIIKKCCLCNEDET